MSPHEDLGGYLSVFGGEEGNGLEDKAEEDNCDVQLSSQRDLDEWIGFGSDFEEISCDGILEDVDVEDIFY